jgi:hypothetical protein
MNTSEINQPDQDMQARLDRLVDGELSSDEYRALLAAFDDEPGGWKRCALAFLESQALATELGVIRQRLSLNDNRHDEPPVAPRRNSTWHEWSLLAVAASFLVAFGLGVVAPRFFSVRQQETQLVGNPLTQPRDNATTGSRHEVLRPVGNIRLVMDGPAGEPTQAGQVPVYEVGQDVEQYLNAEQPVLEPEVIDLLRRHGYDVQHEQQYFPAPLEDGRQIIVPVDGYQITPVGRRY